MPEIYQSECAQFAQHRRSMYSTQRGFADKCALEKVYAKPPKRPQVRPNTGRYKESNKRIEEEQKGVDTDPINYYPGTAYRIKRDTNRRDKLMQTASMKPQTVPDTRPESRYNRATLCAALENGRSQSPEYKVPILQMRLQESYKEQVLLPRCWN